MALFRCDDGRHSEMRCANPDIQIFRFVFEASRDMN